MAIAQSTLNCILTPPERNDMMKHTFEEYKEFAQRILHECCENDMNAMSDITTIFKMLLAIPFELADRTYVYDWNNYKTFKELPTKAKMQLSGSLMWDLNPEEFEKLKKILNE